MRYNKLITWILSLGTLCLMVLETLQSESDTYILVSIGKEDILKSKIKIIRYDFTQLEKLYIKKSSSEKIAYENKIHRFSYYIKLIKLSSLLKNENILKSKIKFIRYNKNIFRKKNSNRKDYNVQKNLKNIFNSFSDIILINSEKIIFYKNIVGINYS